MFAYCNNCPIKYIDSEGTKIKIIDSDPNHRNDLLEMLNALTDDVLVLDGEILIIEKVENGRLTTGTALIRDLIAHSEDIRLYIDDNSMNGGYSPDPVSVLRGDFGNGGYISISRKLAEISELPDFIILAHELVHAWRDTNGLRPNRTFLYRYEYDREEAYTCGFVAGSKYTENMIRKEHFIAERYVTK